MGTNPPCRYGVQGAWSVTNRLLHAHRLKTAVYPLFLYKDDAFLCCKTAV